MSVIRLGIAGAGIAALQALPHLRQIADKIRLTALADVRHDNMAFFSERFGAPLKLFDSVEAMYASGEIDAVWVATPNHLHADHIVTAAARGLHVICEKPMAVTLPDCQRMVDAVETAGVKYVQGHSKVYDTPIRKMGEVLRTGELGRVIHIQSWNWNDWLIRALAADEVDTARGTGVVFRQGPHQVDTVRYLAGGLTRSVRAVAGRWDPSFPDCEGNYTALLEFENGTAATLVFDGYGYFDVSELTWGIGESGRKGRNADSVQPRDRPAGPVSLEDKYALVRAGNPYGYGKGSGWDNDSPLRPPFFGLTIVTCEHGVMRQSPEGLFIYDKNGRREVSCQPHQGRTGELIELYEAVTQDRPTLLDARWGMATAEVVIGILDSSRERRDVMLKHQSLAPAL